MNIVLDGIKILVKPAPGLENVIVVPIPTPEIVPSPITSGLK